MDQARMRGLVEAARVARLATSDADGRPHLVPVCFASAGDRIYSAVDHKPKRSRNLRRLENVRARPWATLLVDHYEDDWTRLWWVRIRGPAEVLVDGAEAERARDLLAGRYPQYRARRPDGPVLALTAAEWRGWSAG